MINDNVDKAVNRYNNAVSLLLLIKHTDNNISIMNKSLICMFCYVTMVANYGIIVNEIVKHYKYNI